MSIVPFHFTASPKNSIQLAIKQEYKTSCSLEGTHAKRHINITVSKAVAPSFLECNLSKCCWGGGLFAYCKGLLESLWLPRSSYFRPLWLNLVKIHSCLLLSPFLQSWTWKNDLVVKISFAI